MLQIHKASAGSGKTYTLTREYIKLLLGVKVHSGADGSGEPRYRFRHSTHYGFGKPKAHGAILAVTFTNKATEEMTTRIIKELARLADRDPADPSPYEAELRQVFRCDAPTLARHARRALNDLLFNFATFNVSTLDSFFQNVLRTFARELDLPGNFNLEIDDAYPVKVAVGNMLESINTPLPYIHGEAPADTERRRKHRRFLMSWIEKYMGVLSERGDSILLFARTSGSHRDLVKTIGSLLGESYRMNREAIDGYLAEPERVERFQGEISRKLAEVESEAVEGARSLLALVPPEGLNANVRRFMQRMAEKPYFTESAKSVYNAAAASGAVKERYVAKFYPQVTPATEGALDAALASATRYLDHSPLLRFIRDNIYILGLFSGVSEHLARYCEEHDAFILADTNDFLRDLIREADAPFIYERLGTRLDHYLIDEFQDTSEMQWANMRPLVFESLSRDEDNLIIGDEKQSIYRFRNSSPDILGSGVQSAVVPRFGPDAVKVRGERVEENTNWRSAPAVVRFNNSLFGPLARLLDDRVDPAARHAISLASAAYAGLVQAVSPKNAELPGMVKVWFAPLAPTSRGRAGLPEAAGAPLTPPRDPEWVLRSLTAEIERQLAAGFRPRDIAVLVRTNFYGHMVIMHLLRRMEEPDWRFGRIPVVSGDALRVDSSLAVQLIIGVMRLAITPEYITEYRGDEPRKVRNAAFRRARLIHRYNLCLFDRVPLLDENGERVTNPDGTPATRRLTHSEALAKAIAATAEPLPGEQPDPVQAEIDAAAMGMKIMDCPSLYAMAEKVIGTMLPAECRRQETPYLSTFMDLVLDFQERGSSSIQEFLRWWDSAGKRSTLDSPSGLDAITVTTIHKSKGLEYECVHVPFCWDEIAKTMGHDWYTLDPAYLPGIDPEIVPPMLPVANSDIKKLQAFKVESERYLHEQRVDSLNVTYVAFTRARLELCVYSDPNVHKERIGPALREAIGQCDAAENERLDAERRRWTMPLAEHISATDDGFELLQIGEPVDKRALDAAAGIHADACVRNKEDGDKQTDGEEPAEYLREGYAVYDRKEFTVTAELDELTRFDFDDERHRGIFLHNVLGRVRHIADLPGALDRAAHRYRLTPRQKEISSAILTEALSDPRVRQWFEGFKRVINERPVTTPSEIRRPDRVVWLADGSVAVIDYKFGTKERRAYFDQVRDYASFLSATLGRPVEGYLWFPLTGRVISVK